MHQSSSSSPQEIPAPTNNNTSNNPELELCTQKSKYCHSQFPDIPTITSHDLLFELFQEQQQQQQQPQNQNKLLKQQYKSSIMLVDVRTKAERSISMIPNAISLRQFHIFMKEQLQQQQSIHNNHKNSKLSSSTTSTKQIELPNKIITYCTIGYRSGFEAQSLLIRYPILRNKVYNLDGIVPYTHAILSSSSSSHHHQDCGLLIHPSTGKSTNQVHVFGSNWNHVPAVINQQQQQQTASPPPSDNNKEENDNDNDNKNHLYKVVYFTKPTLWFRTLQVGWIQFKRRSLGMLYLCKRSCCCKCGREHERGD